MKKIVFLYALMCIACANGFSQSYNLEQLFKKNKLVNFGNIDALSDGDRHGVSCDGIAWLKDKNFSTGTIEIDLKGQDVLQRSFIGVAFHGIDTATFDAIYFRPFNFKSSDSIKKIHAVQYISHPKYTWKKLRAEKNGIYEKGINPPPSPYDWIHAKIVVTETTVSVYVDGATEPSLQINKLNDRKDGLIGLWNFGLPGKFANLTIKQ